jgi:hypothetical protein
MYQLLLRLAFFFLLKSILSEFGVMDIVYCIASIEINLGLNSLDIFDAVLQGKRTDSRPIVDIKCLTCLYFVQKSHIP